MRTALALTLATLALGGCVTAAAPPAPEPGTCGAGKAAAYVGFMASDATLAKVKATSGAQTIRVVGPGDAMTMDYRLDRLTIEIGDDGKIKRLRCV